MMEHILKMYVVYLDEIIDTHEEASHISTGSGLLK